VYVRLVLGIWGTILRKPVLRLVELRSGAFDIVHIVEVILIPKCCHEKMAATKPSSPKDPDFHALIKGRVPDRAMLCRGQFINGLFFVDSHNSWALDMTRYRGEQCYIGRLNTEIRQLRRRKVQLQWKKNVYPQ